MTLGSFIGWLPSRLWCEAVGHDWREAEVPSINGLVAGHECDRCGQKSRNLSFWEG